MAPWLCLAVYGLILCPLSVTFEHCFFPSQAVFIKMKPLKRLDIILDPNCLTLRLYVSKTIDGINNFCNLEKKKLEKKNAINYDH